MIMKEKYDFAVIGGGLTGLITAVLLRKECPDKSLLLIEKNRFFGGLAGTETIGEYFVDSVYFFSNMKHFARYLGIEHEFDDGVQYPFRYVNAVKGEQWHFDVHQDPQKLKAALINKFPEDKQGITRYLGDIEKVYDQFTGNLKTGLNALDIMKLIFTSKELLSVMNITVEKALKRYQFKDNGLFKIVNSFSALGGISSEKLNALIYYIAFGSLRFGALRQKKDFSELVVKLVERLKASGADILQETTVEKISRHNGGHFEIAVSGGKTFYADKIISTIDTKKMFAGIVDKAIMPRGFAEKAAALSMTPSAFIMRLVIKSDRTDYPTNIGQLLFHSDEFAYSKYYDRSLENASPLDRSSFYFAISIREQEKSGYFSIELLAMPVSYGYWANIRKNGEELYKKEIETWEDFYLDRLEEFFEPDLRKKIVQKRSLTPLSIEKAFNVSEGAVFDMAYLNEQTGPKRLPLKTPVKGIYHCKMVHGVFGAFFQSFLVVDEILGGRLNKKSYDFTKLV
jgi:phytoene dehydrogenase-like protein